MVAWIRAQYLFAQFRVGVISVIKVEGGAANFDDLIVKRFMCELEM